MGFLLEGKVDEARECFRKMTKGGSKPDIITYNSLLNGFCKVGDTTAVVQLFRNMEKDRFCKPNIVSYNTVINGLCKDGLCVDALSLFSEMACNRVLPDVYTYNSLIHAACTSCNALEIHKMDS